MKASAVIAKARQQLNDETETYRWSDPELIGWLDQGQKEVVRLEPTANPVNATISLAEGNLQSIPSDGYGFIKTNANMGSDGQTPGKIVNMIDRNRIDILMPDWTTARASSVIHLACRHENPRKFEVYPKPQTPRHLSITYGQIPATVTQLTDDLTLNDTYESVLLDYILYRTLTGETDEAALLVKGEKYRALFYARFQGEQK